VKLVDVNTLNQQTFNVVFEGGVKQISKNALVAKLNDSGLDLVEVSGGDNPIYKIMNFQKTVYEKEKKKKQNTKAHVVKEIKFSVNIQNHDIQTKLKNIKKILNGKDKVKIVVEMKGREVTHPEKAVVLMDNILSQIDSGKPDSKVKVEERFVTVLVKPL